MISPDEAMRIVQESVPGMDHVGQEAILARLKWLQIARPNQIIPEE